MFFLEKYLLNTHLQGTGETDGGKKQKTWIYKEQIMSSEFLSLITGLAG